MKATTMDLMNRAKLKERAAAHWQLCETLCRAANATGNLMSDAWLAALAMEHRCEAVTFDRDFARFPGLRWSSPANSLP